MRKLLHLKGVWNKPRMRSGSRNVLDRPPLRRRFARGVGSFEMARHLQLNSMSAIAASLLNMCASRPGWHEVVPVIRTGLRL